MLVILILSIIIKSTEKSYTYPFNSVSFMLLTVKSFEIFSKHSVHSVYIFMELTNKETNFSIVMQA